MDASLLQGIEDLEKDVQSRRSRTSIPRFVMFASSGIASTKIECNLVAYPDQTMLAGDQVCFSSLTGEPINTLGR